MSNRVSREQATYQGVKQHVTAAGIYGAIAVLALATFGFNMARPFLSSKIFNISLATVGGYALITSISRAIRGGVFKAKEEVKAEPKPAPRTYLHILLEPAEFPIKGEITKETLEVAKINLENELKRRKGLKKALKLIDEILDVRGEIRKNPATATPSIRLPEKMKELQSLRAEKSRAIAYASMSILENLPKKATFSKRVSRYTSYLKTPEISGLKEAKKAVLNGLKDITAKLEQAQQKKLEVQRKLTEIDDQIALLRRSEQKKQDTLKSTWGSKRAARKELTDATAALARAQQKRLKIQSELTAIGNQITTLEISKETKLGVQRRLEAKKDRIESLLLRQKPIEEEKRAAEQTLEKITAALKSTRKSKLKIQRELQAIDHQIAALKLTELKEKLLNEAELSEAPTDKELRDYLQSGQEDLLNLDMRALIIKGTLRSIEDRLAEPTPEQIAEQEDKALTKLNELNEEIRLARPYEEARKAIEEGPSPFSEVDESPIDQIAKVLEANPITAKA